MAYYYRLFCARKASSSSHGSYIRTLYSASSHYYTRLRGEGGVRASGLPGSAPLCDGDLLSTNWFSRRSFSVAAVKAKRASSAPHHHPQSSLLSSPWLMIPSTEFDADYTGSKKKKKKGVADTTADDESSPSLDYCFYRLADQTVFSLNNKAANIPKDARCVGSSHGWLAYISPSDCSLFLTNPIISPVPPTIPLPPIGTLSTVLCTFRCSHNSTVVKYILMHIEDPICDLRYSKTPEAMCGCFIKKLVMSSSPVNISNCTVMAIHGEYGFSISFCKPGDKSWTNLEDQGHWGYTDIAYSNTEELFYAIRYSNEIEAWDLKNPNSPKLIHIGEEMRGPNRSKYQVGLKNKCLRTRYLVESFGDVLLVERFVAYGVTADDKIRDDFNNKVPYKTLYFDIYKLDTCDRKTWEYVNCIGDRVLFLGSNHSFSLSALDFPELSPNSIYFTDKPDSFDLFANWETYHYGGHDMGVYHLRDSSFTPHYPRKIKKFLPPPIWVAPNPCWLP